MDLTGRIFEHKKYGEYEVLNRVLNNKKQVYYRIKFKNSKYETEAKASNIRNKQVRDKFYHRNLLLGNIYTNNVGQEYKVVSIDDRNSENLFIEFLSTGSVVSRNRANVLKGSVYDNKGVSKSVIFDKFKNKMVKRRSYSMYMAMKNRVKTRGSIICKQWDESFDSFLDWLYNIELKRLNVNSLDFELYIELKEYELDKNFILEDNNYYSPETCKLIRKDLNMSIRNLENAKIKLKKDGVVIDVINFKKFIKDLGYEILE